MSFPAALCVWGKSAGERPRRDPGGFEESLKKLLSTESRTPSLGGERGSSGPRGCGDRPGMGGQTGDKG